MRQGSKGKKTGAGPKPRVARRPRKRSKTKVQANRVVAKKALKREGSEPREPDKRLAEALQRQAATDEILRVMSSSPGNVHPVLNAVAERAAGLCDAAFAQVLLVEGDVLHPTAAYWADVGLDKSPGPKRTWPLTRSLAIGRAALDRETIHHADVVPLLSTDYPTGRAKQQELGFRAVLVVPLLREGGASGVIFMFRREPRPFSPEQIALVETFARQAVIAIENVRLFNETKEALEQQTATSEILRVISRSPRDVQPVFDTIVKNAVRLCEARFGAVFRLDGGLVHLAAHHNFSGELLSRIQRWYPMAPNRGHVSGRAIFTGTAVQVPDILADEEYLGTTLKAAGFRSLLGVPLLRGERPIGAIVIYRAEAGEFVDKHIQLLKTFADQAVIAIENVRLFNETKEALEQQKASGEVLATISSSIADTAPVFDKILQSCERLFAGTLVTIHILGEDGLTRIVAHQGPNREAFMASPPAPVTDQRATGICIRRRTVLHYPDTEDEAVPPGTREGGRLVGTRAAIFAPMLWDGRAIGVIAVCRVAPGPFSDKEIALLKTFADQAVIAIQNARLFREIQDKSRELETASRHKSEFLANMSHELRTPLNAIIGFSEVLSERMFGEINEKQAEYLDDILESGRHLLSLINDILDLSKIEAGRMELEATDFDLPSAIESTLMLVRERAHRRGITLARNIDERLAMIRGDERKVKQVLLNLLSNALKFTPEGGRIDVRADLRDGLAEISVTDTGVGIAPEDQETVFEEFRQVGMASKKVEGTGLGLAISRKFIELHCGKIWVKSQVGAGSTFAFTLPLQ